MYSAQTTIGQVKKKYINADQDYTSSMELDLNPDSTFKYVFHHSLGSCYAKGSWSNQQDTILLLRNISKAPSDDVKMWIFPNFIGKDRWLFRNDTLYLLEKTIVTKVKLIRS